MPIYQYCCPECGTVEEALRPISARDEPLVCPSEDCKGAAMTRNMTYSEFRMKGGTRNHNRIKMWSVQDRMNAKYGDNP